MGQHPGQAVKVMSDVALEAEAALPYERIISEKVGQQQTDDAISYDACRTAFQLKASLIVAFTESGSTANRVSKYRPQPPVLALTPHARVRQRMTLRWGVIPVIAQVVESIEDFFLNGQDQAMEAGLAEEGNLVVLVAGLPIGLRGTTNLLRVMTISSSESDGQ